MKITAVTVFEVQGTMEHEGEFWEERLIRPLDIYPEHKEQGPNWLEKLGDDSYRIQAHFVQIETDHGVYGIGGSMSHEQATIINHQLAPLLIGHDPLAIERL